VTIPVLSCPVDVAEVRRSGSVAVDVATKEADRAALAEAYDVKVTAMAATATLPAHADGGILVEGRVIADIVQTCVVSLVPVDQHIDEPFEARFAPPGSREHQPPKPHAEVVVDPNAPDPPEPLTGPTIDVGAVAEEAFALAIDPYPRAPDATLPEVADPDAEGDSPFAALADLIKPEKSR